MTTFDIKGFMVIKERDLVLYRVARRQSVLDKQTRIKKKKKTRINKKHSIRQDKFDFKECGIRE